MNFEAILLVTLALMPLLVIDKVSAAPSNDTAIASAIAQPAVFSASPATLQPDCTQVSGTESRSASRQTPDTIADCRESRRTRGWTKVDLPAVPVWATRNELVF